METISFEIDHCGHCLLRSKDIGRGDRCYLFEVKDVSKDVKNKTLNEYCPLRRCEIVIKQKKL